jgi:hypothetical protein
MSDRWHEDMRRQYVCKRVERPIDLGCDVLDPGWLQLPWSAPFADITGRSELEPRHKTRVRMGWDNRYLYINAELEEPHVWGTITEKNAVMFEDNDFEVFLDPDCDGLNYYEFEINALGTIWELSLPKSYAAGGKPILGCNIDELVSRVRIDGTLNNPADSDNNWTVEIAIPWAGLAPYHHSGSCPPIAGDRWRINFSRVQWQHRIEDGRYIRIPPHGTPLAESLNPEEQEHPEDNWVWSPQGTVNMHLPERWGEVVFK